MTAQKQPKTEQFDSGHSIVLFDGVCRFCNGWVQFILKHDKHDQFRFSPLQSDFVQGLLMAGHLHNISMDSVILLDGSKVYTHSSAVLQIFKQLGGGWSLLSWFRAVPRPIREAVYRFIAKRRYQLFGKYDSCMIPDANVRSKFMD
ncbi:thiol-disulfide oxidoreductase DCC family protein [Paenibacillus agricola]|uniref:Thiol-disulfide oxidoreductase DCC family protein n=1 Tax=Paenibacillus agricola TaxID=2716264 RepID=A0ABX0JFX4_9BACL|nr:thiol-disulfide oxidoreductase DCC family protein [Paenibacillus agricola]NHN33792.1 thiol-disulfide oxidoreductase DCC family protein [Paenibacillus agricola]